MEWQAGGRMCVYVIKGYSITGQGRIGMSRVPSAEEAIACLQGSVNGLERTGGEQSGLARRREQAQRQH
ncbi:unnamed protein product [Clonostachys chloroleuca]|uniref:Uncharacterized protein n=1 Tax=Clonostachys chloroleuca TaxID=1926264 RepID=A0AA35MA16_9HYPO|nr:unnamed protein product [Clonostachys chloroleuca]